MTFIQNLILQKNINFDNVQTDPVWEFVVEEWILKQYFYPTYYPIFRLNKSIVLAENVGDEIIKWEFEHLDRDLNLTSEWSWWNQIN